MLLVYAFTIIPIALVVLVLAFATHISPDRIGELARLAVVFSGGLLLALPWLPQFLSWPRLTLVETFFRLFSALTSV